MTPSCSQRPARRTTGRESSLLPADSTFRAPPAPTSQRCNNKLTPVRIQAPCVYRKIATRLKRDGAESLGFRQRSQDWIPLIAGIPVKADIKRVRSISERKESNGACRASSASPRGVPYSACSKRPSDIARKLWRFFAPTLPALILASRTTNPRSGGSALGMAIHRGGARRTTSSSIEVPVNSAPR